ncbi:MAG: rRNA maturation RNase YbeY [Phycisphaerales bacterium JB060]
MIVHLDHESPAGNEDPEPASTAEEPPERTQPGRGLIVDLVTSGGLRAEPDVSARAWLVDHVQLVASRLEVAGELRVRLVGDVEMAAAHERHLGNPTTTDVMTFDLADGAAARGEPVDADLLVCVDEAARVADEHGHQIERELLLYIVHGLLHCLGYDDHDEAAYAQMHALEDELLTSVGVGATFTRRVGERGS